MRDLSTLTHFPIADKLADVLMAKVNNETPIFFRVLIAYYFCKLASIMGVKVLTHGKGLLPVNGYVINLATSGAGKTMSTTIMETQVLNQFIEKFEKETFKSVSEKNLAKLAVDRAARFNSDPDDMIKKVDSEFKDLGPYLFDFDSATSPAVKQLRHKILMAGIGAINLEIDEIGSNLSSNTEALNVFLELYDIGRTKTKLIKSGPDAKRNIPITGLTPTNMLLYGTPSKLLASGSKEENEFFSMLETGYARRCFFGYCKHLNSSKMLTAAEIYALETDGTIDTFIKKLSNRLGKLANEIHHNTVLQMTKDVAILINEYRIDCQLRANKLPEYKEVVKAELIHRFSKVTKLAGAYAFIDGSPDIKEDHIYYAIKLAEESGEAFNQIMEREKPYEALAKFIVSHDTELTAVDLIENLPCFKGSEAARKNLLTLATAYGYKNNMIIKKTYTDGIEFFSGETLELTDLSNMIVSYSQDMTTGFVKDEKPIPFDKLQVLVQAPGYHYCAHMFKNGYRSHENQIEGFNLLMLDVDGGVTLDNAKMLLKDYKAIFSTTKRHTPLEHRFRVIMPLSHVIKLDPVNYSKFMENVYNWLPFKVDEAAKDCARKWESHKGDFHIQDGDLVNALMFIPNTSEEEKQSKRILDNADLSGLERWFHMNITNGNRNNQMLRYALALVDSRQPVDVIRNTLHAFNKKVQFPVAESEINDTIMKTVIKRSNPNLLVN